MERMIRRIAVKKDGTISMSEFRNFAEKSQGEINELEQENKKLKEELKDKQKVIQYYRKEKKLMGTQIKKLKEELRKYKKQYQHSMGFSDFGGYDE